MRKNETPEKTVSREVREETGYSVTVGKELGSLVSTYTIDNTVITKTTNYYICEPIERVSQNVGEHDEVCWVELNKAIKLVSSFKEYEDEEKILTTFKVSMRK